MRAKLIMILSVTAFFNLIAFERQRNKINLSFSNRGDFRHSSLIAVVYLRRMQA